jgi:hypothetical protein
LFESVTYDFTDDEYEVTRRTLTSNIIETLYSVKAARIPEALNEPWNSHSDLILPTRGVHFVMATDTQRYQIFFGIGTGVAAVLFVVNFQVRHRPAQLTPPAVTTQHLLA